MRALPFAAPVLVTAHSDVLTWWVACRGEKPPPEWDAYGRRVAAGIAEADLLIAPTQAYFADLVAQHGRPAAHRVIPNGRDPSRFQGSAKRAMALGAGRLWDEAKNIEALCKAAEGLSWPVLIAGEAISPDGGTIRTPANVVSLGKLAPDDLAARMAEAALFVSPARYEPFRLGRS
jgi:glycosyltransferase involved in cell wall biosynthesis